MPISMFKITYLFSILNKFIIDSQQHMIPHRLKNDVDPPV